jgi:hypothetical protein
LKCGNNDVTSPWSAGAGVARGGDGGGEELTAAAKTEEWLDGEGREGVRGEMLGL